MSQGKIIVPDAALREWHQKYDKYLPKPEATPPQWVDEDLMYKLAMGLSTEELDSGFKSSK